MWAHTYGTTADESISDVAVGPSGNIYIIGQMTLPLDFGAGPLTALGGADVFVAVFDPSGTLIWAQSAGAAEADLAYALTISAAGNIFLSRGSPSGGVVESLFPTTGLERWQRTFSSSPNGIAIANVAVGPEGEVVASGNFINLINLGGGAFDSGSNSNVQGFLVKLVGQ